MCIYIAEYFTKQKQDTKGQRQPNMYNNFT